VQPYNSGRTLISEIETTLSVTPTLWWLGHSSFAIKFASITFYIDPCFSEIAGRARITPPALSGAEIHNADLIFVTHAHPGHLNGPTLLAMIDASPRARIVMPKSAAEHAHSLGIPYKRMTTTDSDLRVEFFKDNLYARAYAVPSAHPELAWTPIGGYPYLGYLMRFGRWTIYHAGDCVLYHGIVERLKPFNVNVALLPVSGNNFSMAEAAQLATSIGASWIVPMHYATFGSEDGTESRFVTHMLGRHPEQAFKVFKLGEGWTVPEE
jgi:L-ascorbate metabolism protein UlaG (beta-lactamase superfamily)